MSHSGAAVEMAGKAIAVVAAIETAATALRVRVFTFMGCSLRSRRPGWTAVSLGARKPRRPDTFSVRRDRPFVGGTKTVCAEPCRSRTCHAVTPRQHLLTAPHRT